MVVAPSADHSIYGRSKNSMFRKIRALFEPAFQTDSDGLHLAISDEGATLLDSNAELWTFRWIEVSRIEAYKLDLLIVDSICLNFFIEPRQLWYHTNDELSGFDDICRELVRYFPSVPNDWWSTVAFPAFATNHMVLYDRSANTPC